MTDPPQGATATARLVLEPQVRTFSSRRWVIGMLGIPLLVLAAYAAVVRLSALEQMLVADTAHASRVVLYELPRGGAVIAPIEPGTQIIRLALHAYRRDRELEIGKRKTRLEVALQGSRGHRVEDVTIDVPGQRTRVTSDEPGLAIGDPVGVDFDVHDLGAGELTVNLADLDQADGLLVRMYRREALSPAKATAREDLLDLGRKNHLARWTWELAWDDASPDEQEEILQDRWRRVGALRGAGHDLRSIAVALVPRPAEGVSAHRDDSLGSLTLRGDERLGFVLHEHASLRATSDLETTLKATLRDLHGGVRTLSAQGELTVGGLAEGGESLELGADQDVRIDVRTSDPGGVERFGYSQAWRASAALPVVVESPEADRLLRVTARRPVDRGQTTSASVEALVELSAPSLPAPVRRTMRAERTRSRFDRYEAYDPIDAPTERFAFYVAVPRGGKVTIAPRGPESLDLSLAELDPTKGLEPLRGRGLLEAPPPVESVGSFTWAGFAARRPSNAEAFESKQRPLIRVARHFVEAESPAAVPLLVHFTLPAGPRVESDGRSFVGVGATFRAELGVRRPLLIPMRVLGEAGTKLELRLAPGRGPKRAAAGIFDRVTLPRTVIVGPGPTRATLVVGDDVPAGPVTLEVVVLPRTPERQAGAAPLAGSVAPLFVHLPWATRHPPLPRWIAGQFEE